MYGSLQQLQCAFSANHAYTMILWGRLMLTNSVWLMHGLAWLNQALQSSSLQYCTAIFIWDRYKFLWKTLLYPKVSYMFPVNRNLMLTMLVIPTHTWYVCLVNYKYMYITLLSMKEGSKIQLDTWDLISILNSYCSPYTSTCMVAW